MKKKKHEGDITSPPKRCPLMKECTEDVAWDTFDTICNTEDWIFCEYAEKEAKKYKRKPYEWKLIKELGGFPEEGIDPRKKKG